MLEDAPEAGCLLGEELRVAVEKEEGDGEEECVGCSRRAFGKVPMEEGVSCALDVRTLGSDSPWRSG